MCAYSGVQYINSYISFHVIDHVDSANADDKVGEDLVCPVCTSEGPPKPDGAHKCFVCSKPVHAFGCSIPRGQGEEGYGGQDRICLSCSKKGKALHLIYLSAVLLSFYSMFLFLQTLQSSHLLCLKDKVICVYHERFIWCK